MVILDSDHSKEHVLQEMDMYGPLVCVGCYMVVQDTHLNGYPVHVAFSPGPGKQGPMEAVHEFLARNSDFVVDRDREKYGLTFNPNGWLEARPLKETLCVSRIKAWDAVIIAVVCLFAGAGSMLWFVTRTFFTNRCASATGNSVVSASRTSPMPSTASITTSGGSKRWRTRWLGTETMQTPLDLWVVQEILHETRPDVLMETGTRLGGGAAYYASIMDLLRHGRILTVDIENLPGKPEHSRIEYFTGSSTDPAIVGAMKAKVKVASG
ncbi:MAG: hypothetical protein IPM24_19975 [Bryobacterales bacterium]|nr:hypothetical protein [Bryobacterales bacterium]